MQLGNFIDVLLARHVSGTYAHHQEHWMLSCSVWFSASSFWMGGGLERRSCVQCGWCRARHHPHLTQWLSRPPPIQKLGPEIHMLQSTSNAPDNGSMHPKHVELRVHQ